MLSSESTFIPFTSDLEPQTTHSDSEDETETFEPDSLAQNHPTQSKKHNTNKAHTHSPTVDNLDKNNLKEVISGAATTAGSQVPKVSTSQHDLETSSDSVKGAMTETSKQEEVGICTHKPSLIEADRAVVKIQSWWRGQYTRRFHPVAREVRSEIRLCRMQEHILFLSEKLGR